MKVGAGGTARNAQTRCHRHELKLTAGLIVTVVRRSAHKWAGGV
jgi:hypothetical protein